MLRWRGAAFDARVPYSANVPDHGAAGLPRLRAAGAILIGKTTTPEFG